MPNQFVQPIIDKIQADFGKLNKVGNGYSLYEVASNGALIYFRYSKLFKKSYYTQGFYGLRDEDIKPLSGRDAFICFVCDSPVFQPVFLPFRNFEYSFSLYPPSSDGQYKTFIIFKPTNTEFYLANVGKFNVDCFSGLSQLYEIGNKKLIVPELSHTDIQSLVGAIGLQKGYELWYPDSDKVKIDTNIVDQSKIIENLPTFGKEINHIISEIDCIWLQHSKPVSFFEVEHSTPIYSGLLRFNDVLLTVAGVDNFNIVADRERENKFGREINRPTFKQNKLIDRVTFLDYENIYNWYYNLCGKTYARTDTESSAVQTLRLN